MAARYVMHTTLTMLGLLSILCAATLSGCGSGKEDNMGHRPDAEQQAVGTILLVLPPEPTPVIENIARIFKRQVESRCDTHVVMEGEAPLVVELAVRPGVGTEGFKIADGGENTVRIIGNDERGLLYGVGKFLRTSRYGAGGFTAGKWRGVSVPKMPVRGMYLATHFENYYQSVPIDDVRQYVEDIALWGANSFLVWFGQEAYESIDDPEAQAQLERLRALLKTAKDLGLNVSLGSIGNDGYKNSPEELRATMVQWNLGNELCPNKPGVMDMEMQYAQEKFDAFKSIGLDYWFVVPYDNGGCGCEKCSPWGTNGFLMAAEPVARAFPREFPGGKVIMSTWYFSADEWKGLKDKFREKKPDWVQYIMCDDPSDLPRKPLADGSPGDLPLLNFPEISMWNQGPWGSYGANPFPSRLQARWDGEGKFLSGGFPYSEGIYEDMNKVVCLQHYWSPDRTAMETIREYIAFEFSPEVVDDVAAVVQILEMNHYREAANLRGSIGVSAISAFQMMKRADAKLTPQARKSWRWRLLYIRAMLDQELYRDSLRKGRDEVFQQAYDELIDITRTQNARHMLRPILIHATEPAPVSENSADPDETKADTEGPTLAAEYAKIIAKSKPIAWWRMKLVDGLYIDDASGSGNIAGPDGGVTLRNADDTAKDHGTTSAANLHGGRMMAMLRGLGDTYTIECWIYNTLYLDEKPVTGYFFSSGTPGDNLGITGTSLAPEVPPGRLYYYNGSGNTLKQLVGTTELVPNAWNHVVFVRDGDHVAVYLNGRAEPGMSGDVKRTYPDGLARIIIGGRPDGFANFQGKIAEVSLYDRALTPDEVSRHHNAANMSSHP